MPIEEEIAEEAVNAAWNQFQRMPSSNPSDYAHAVTRTLSPLLNRVRAEALREAARFLRDFHSEYESAETLEMYAREIEQNREEREGNET